MHSASKCCHRYENMQRYSLFFCTYETKNYDALHRKKDKKKTWTFFCCCSDIRVVCLGKEDE